ncbi:hypothetical protein WDW89_17190 [Deltaproteobacteria bacterium TL4]
MIEFFLIVPIKAFSQNAPVLPNCELPGSKNEEYQCFLIKQDLDLKRVQEEEQRQIQNKKIKEELLAKKIKDLEIEEQKKQEERRLLAEPSKQRNKSHKGEKYKVTFGRVIEPKTP